MDAQAVMTISAAVVACTQLSKWAGLPDRLGPLVVLLLAAVGVGVWVYAQGSGIDRSDTFDLFAGWISVATSAAGVYGFTRQAASTLTRMMPPPTAGAGSERTIP